MHDNMKQIHILFLIFFLIIFVSCSSDSEGDEMPTSITNETFGNWSPDFTNQTSNFTQTRVGSKGTEQTRTIEVTSSSNLSESNEENLNQDVNNDGDKLDSIEISTITYVATENLGQFEVVSYEIKFNNSNENLVFEFIYETPPSIGMSGEGLGYISINSKHYILIPFATLGREGATTPDYLRIFEIDSTEGKLHDRTFSIFDQVPEVGFPKGPLFIEDFDKDGFDDIFLVDHGQEDSYIDNKYEGDFLKFYYGSENGFVKDQTPEISNKKLFYHHADVSDFDLDGDLDIISQRWSSQSEEVPNGNSITIFENLGNRNYEIIDLESPPAGVGSVLFSNIDDDPELEVLSFDYGGGVIWSWDITENKTEIINNQLGEYQIHDVIEVENGNNSTIIMFPEDYGGITPIFKSNDKCLTINNMDIINDWQGRDVYIIDLNGDNLDDIFMYGVNDYEDTVNSVRTMKNTVLINQGNNEFIHPNNILDSNNKSVNDLISDDFLPLKKTKDGYMFFEFEKGIPPKFGTMYNLKFE